MTAAPDNKHETIPSSAMPTSAPSARKAATLPPDYFDGLYAEKPDPWNFESSVYEHGKYTLTLAALPLPRYRSALEVGCSIGVLTRRLALRCDKLLAVDLAAAALAQAQARCADLPHVSFRTMVAPKEWPDEKFDLVMLSEVVYYFDAGDVGRLAARVASSLLPNGTIVLVHWLGETNYPLSGDDAATLFMARMDRSIQVERTERRKAFRIDVLRRR